jgi:hypothetical protein
MARRYCALHKLIVVAVSESGNIEYLMCEYCKAKDTHWLAPRIIEEAEATNGVQKRNSKNNAQGYSS